MKAREDLKGSKSFIEWPVYMQRAIDLATNVLRASPNPRVGCVIVNEQEIVGEGWHIAAGYDHAEIMALKNANQKAQGGTAFVTLEPCSFSGRTGPCSDALIDAGIKNVVIPGLDPDERVSGNGVKKLEDAGIQVVQMQDFEAQARSLNLGYFKRHENNLPYVRLKLAMSLDGRTALANGDSQWISSTESRADVQKLRGQSSAILTGVGTILSDDPTLNVRIEEMDLTTDELAANKQCLEQQPLRVVLDSLLRTPAAARIFSAAGSVKVFTTNSADNSIQFADNVEIVEIDADGKRVDLKSVLESLASKYACNDVLIEAGPTLSGRFLDMNLVDELIVYIAPKILGSDAKPLFEITGLTSLAEAMQFQISEVTQIGNDIKAVLKKAR